jgi:hypothetical protein
MKKNYDVLLIPTGETSFRDRRLSLENDGKLERELYQDKHFPVSSKAAELFKQGNIGYIFVTGGNHGLSNGVRFFTMSEAKETAQYLSRIKGINPDKIYQDNRSHERLGGFALPIANPQNEVGVKEDGVLNPNLTDFKKILIIGKKGNKDLIEDYAKLIIPSQNEVDYYSVNARVKGGRFARKHHEALMHVLDKKYGKDITAQNVVDFLYHDHPYYSSIWDMLPLWRRKVIAKRKIRDWMKA